MSYRLKNLAVGNFLLIFEADGSGRMTETLAAVASVTPVDDAGEESVYGLVGVCKNSYSSSWASRTVSSAQDLKFTPLAKDEADLWLATHGISAKFAATLQQAKAAFVAAELARDGLNSYFGGLGQAVLEAPTRAVNLDEIPF